MSRKVIFSASKVRVLVEDVHQDAVSGWDVNLDVEIVLRVLV
jgi:hypothetical protein